MKLDAQATKKPKGLTLYLKLCQSWGLLVQQQIKIWCQKYGQIEIQLSDE